MNGKDFISVLEYMKAFNKPTKAGKRRKVPDLYTGDLDLVALLRKKQLEAKIIEDFMKEHEKLNKKEEKKDDKPKSLLSVPQITMLLVASFPITAPLYVSWMQGVLKSLH